MALRRERDTKFSLILETQQSLRYLPKGAKSLKLSLLPNNSREQFSPRSLQTASTWQNEVSRYRTRKSRVRTWLKTLPRTRKLSQSPSLSSESFEESLRCPYLRVRPKSVVSSIRCPLSRRTARATSVPCFRTCQARKIAYSPTNRVQERSHKMTSTPTSQSSKLNRKQEWNT